MTQLLEYVKMALKNIWANKIRTFLTMLGIIIGISSVILIISVGNGATELITSELGDLGKGQIAFVLKEYDEKYLVTQDDLKEIRQIKGVKAATGQVFYEGTTKTKKDEFTVNFIGIDQDGFEFLESKFVKGRPFNEREADDGKKVCVISEEDAMKFFGSTDVVGMDIVVTLYEKYDVNLTIIGVTESKEDNNKITSMLTSPTAQIIVPTNTFGNAFGFDVSSELDSFYVLTEDDADPKQVTDDVVEYLETAHHAKGKDVYYFQSFDDIMKTVNKVINLLTAFVAFVASVSLVVGGIGVMNIMLVSVTERTREIGIRKALGAKTGSITIQFLAESAFITLIGGIFGILFGVMGAWMIARMIGMLVPGVSFSPVLSIKTILLASLFSSAVGIFFGIYPARKAAKLSPIEALRHE
ncbi:MAG: FtsX-like permease family protein [Lachnospiraceae bacterium]|jgi:putative ABC transport system permease protein|nr:FtsX-like permease family protein [Lachnospiraceae bacterium]